MSEYKVGDRVKVFGDQTGTVKYGPVPSTFAGRSMYVVERESDGERAFKSSDLEPLPKFAVGDKVRYSGTLAELTGGPVIGATSGEELFLLKFLEGPDSGKGVARRASKLEPVTEPTLVPVGTRVRVNRARYAERTHGKIGIVTSNTATFAAEDGDRHRYHVELGGEDARVYAAEVTPVDELADGFEHQGTVYEYGVKYRDREGDLFEFRSRRSDDGTNTPEGRIDFAAPDDWNWSLAEVVRDYGPITKQ
ncbi:phiSA1p31-related protein [Streptomyces sp. NPDC058542]|uniref:phiSA1p31-related protein n=1 Tax=Streptomyces sp. NPDC058542 TaxID=3346543 RepID=UPI00365070EC